MKSAVFCKMCGEEIDPVECALTFKRNVKGKEVYFCCPHCKEEYKEAK